MKFDCMKPDCRLLRNAVYQKIVFCMRLSAISMGVLLFSAQLLNANPGGAQELDNVSLRLELRNETLINAFKKIEKQCNFYFAYKDKQVKAAGSISLSDATRSLRETLNLILANTALSYK